MWHCSCGRRSYGIASATKGTKLGNLSCVRMRITSSALAPSLSRFGVEIVLFRACQHMPVVFVQHVLWHATFSACRHARALDGTAFRRALQSTADSEFAN